MSGRSDRTNSSDLAASHATVDSRHFTSSSPLLLSHSHPSSSPTHHSPPPPIPNSNSTTTTDQSPTDTSPPPPLPLPTSMEDGDGATATPPAPRPSHNRPSFPVREDCWSEEATYTLIEVWGDRFLELNRGHLRQQQWQEVADAVNALHGHVKKARRTHLQCKNRIDTLKKKYKIEKSRVSNSDSNSYTSQWPFFVRLNALIGPSYNPSPPVTAPHRKKPSAPPLALLPPPSSVPVGPRSKRPVSTLSPAVVVDSFFRRNFSAMAAAAAAEAEEESEMSRSKSRAGCRWRDGGGDGADGYGELAEAIERLGERYERVEAVKQRQLIELEKQRMQFAKDLEVQRMKLFMDLQIQLGKIKRTKPTSEADCYL